MASHAWLGVLGAFALASANAHADYLQGTFPTIVGETTSSYLYDESINHQTGFAISQNDPRLRSLFKDPYESMLCVPTALANSMAYLKLWRSPSFPQLRLAQDPIGSGDYSETVIDFANRCKTDRERGTANRNTLECVRNFFSDSGYASSQVFLIGPEGQGTRQRPVTFDDIRYYVRKDFGILLEVVYFKFDPSKKAWIHTGHAHMVSVVGEDYDQSWGEKELHLKIINPDVNYRERASNSRWDFVEMLKVPTKPGIVYPPQMPYTLEGFDFKGMGERAFVRNLLVFLPTEE